MKEPIERKIRFTCQEYDDINASGEIEGRVFKAQVSQMVREGLNARRAVGMSLYEKDDK